MHRPVPRTRAPGWLAGVAVLACTQLGAAATAPPPPVEAFAMLPNLEFIRLSPDGKLLAQDDQRNGQRRLVIWEIATAKPVRVVDIDAGNKLRDLQWADDQTLLLTVSAQKALPCTHQRQKWCPIEWFRTLGVALDNSPPRLLLMGDPERKYVTSATTLAARTSKPNTITMSTLDFMASKVRASTGTRLNESERDNSGWTAAVFSVDTTTGKGRLIETGTAHTLEWAVDHDGVPIARSEWLAERENFALVVKQGSNWRVIYDQSMKEPLELLGVSMDGKSLVMVGAIDGDRRKAWSFPLDGSAPRILYDEPGGEIRGGALHDDTHAVVGVSTGGLSPTIRWLEPKLASQFRSLSNAFPGKRVTEIGRSTHDQRVLVKTDSPSQPPVYHLVDFDKSRADIVGDAYPPLANARLGEVKSIHYAARDGTPIPAYLTVPPGREARGLPLVVLPHGGPHSHDEDNFDYLVQFLATRGYAVLQPQFRGSTGFGDAFMRAGYKQWGGLMQDDVTDGVRRLVSDGTADPRRICIVGMSYGGYAALAGAAFTPELYVCAASVGGISELPTFLQEQEVAWGSESDGKELNEERIGRGSDPSVIARSPARSAAAVRAPVLLMHGVDDSVVPILQSERMEKALRAAGKPVTFIKLVGEDHWLSRAETRLQVLKELDAFLARHLH